MAIATLFQKMRVGRTVLKRTRANNEFPPFVLYTGALLSEHGRQLLDAHGKEHRLSDKIIESNYKIIGKSESKRLIAAHWSEDVAPPREPVRKQK